MSNGWGGERGGGGNSGCLWKFYLPEKFAKRNLYLSLQLSFQKYIPSPLEKAYSHNYLNYPSPSFGFPSGHFVEFCLSQHFAYMFMNLLTYIKELRDLSNKLLWTDRKPGLALYKFLIDRLKNHDLVRKHN